MPKKYADGMINGVQQYSIGYGHQILPGEKHLLTATLSKAQADAIFEKDLLKYETAVNATKRSLTQNQFDALVSFAYNAGTGAVAKVLETWNATGDSLKTTDRMKLYNKWRKGGVLQVHSGLVSRRLREASMFLNGVAEEIAEEVKKKVQTCPHCGLDIDNLVPN